jgi:hypothetical protein
LSVAVDVKEDGGNGESSAAAAEVEEAKRG